MASFIEADNAKLATTNGKYFCQYCDICFVSQNDCQDHESRHDPKTPFLCNICTIPYADRSALICHIINSHDTSGAYVCAICKSAFYSRQNLQNHSVTHIELQLFACSVCSKRFLTSSCLGQHIGIHENNDIPAAYKDGKSEMNEQPKSSHVCDTSCKSFIRERNLRRQQALRLATLFTCKECGINFNGRGKLIRHELEEHGPQYPCKVCRIKFHNREELKVHLKIHESPHNVAPPPAHQRVFNVGGTVRQQMPQLRPNVPPPAHQRVLYAGGTVRHHMDGLQHNVAPPAHQSERNSAHAVNSPIHETLHYFGLPTHQALLNSTDVVPQHMDELQPNVAAQAHQGVVKDGGAVRQHMHELQHDFAPQAHQDVPNAAPDIPFSILVMLNYFALSIRQALINVGGPLQNNVESPPVLNTTCVGHPPLDILASLHHSVIQAMSQSQPSTLSPAAALAAQRVSDTDLISTMNFGFCSETPSENCDGIREKRHC